MIFGHFVRKRCGLVTSGIQHISAMMFLVAGSSELYQRIRQGRDPDKVIFLGDFNENCGKRNGCVPRLIVSGQ